MTTQDKIFEASKLIVEAKQIGITTGIFEMIISDFKNRNIRTTKRTQQTIKSLISA